MKKIKIIHGDKIARFVCKKKITENPLYTYINMSDSEEIGNRFMRVIYFMLHNIWSLHFFYGYSSILSS